MRPSGMFILCLHLAVLFPGGAFAKDWPFWRGPERNGSVSGVRFDVSTLEQGKTLWTVNVGKGFSSLAIRGNYLYTLGNNRYEDTVYCLDARTGETVWSYSYACRSGTYPGPRATPATDGEYVYTLSQEGHLFCFDATRGDVIWQKNISIEENAYEPQWGFAGSPVIEGNLILLNAGPSGMALDKRTGNAVWSSGRGAGGYAAVTIFRLEGALYAAVFGRRALTAVEVSTGRKLWSHPHANRSEVNAADPAIADGRIFISSGYGKGCELLDIRSSPPRQVWQNKNMKSHFSSAVIVEGYIYGNDGDARYHDGVFRCLDIRNGRETWSAELGFGSLISVNGYLVMLTERGALHVAELTPSRYREVAKIQLVRGQYWTPPALSNGLLYCRNSNGDVICIDAGGS